MTQDKAQPTPPAVPSDGLLPCPFCGGEDIRITDHGKIGTGMWHRDQRVYTLGCYHCGATCCAGGMYEQYGRQKLIEAWNTRATTPSLPAAQAVEAKPQFDCVNDTSTRREERREELDAGFDREPSAHPREPEERW